MTKLKFLLSLHEKLKDLPQNEVEARLNFYSEMIEDRIEEGLSEEEAVAAVGSVDEIAAQIAADIAPASAPADKPAPKRHRKSWEIALLILGSPLWFPLLIAAFAVAVSLYIALWSVVISLWAVPVSLIGCAVGISIGGIVFAAGGHGLTGTALIGAGTVCAGLAIAACYICKWVTAGAFAFTKKSVLFLKDRIMRKEKKQ